ncbi:MAG TPA: GGDEF domain-containing protein [Planctomycetota bacterium]|nr:GGDEF domain-containing protein [Planctomycetota bacterium]
MTAVPSLLKRVCQSIEGAAPFAAGGILIASGTTSALHTAGLTMWGGPMAGAALPVSLLVGGAGTGLIVASWDAFQARRQLKAAQQDLLRAQAQRDVALLQARRMRAQAEGLTLMREIHRSTAIPDRHERLHRILILLADLFEAREVSLFAAAEQSAARVHPAACLRITNKEELFITFDLEELQRLENLSDGADAGRKSGTLRVAKNSATIVREGCQLFVEGTLVRNASPVAKAQWRRGAQAVHDALASNDPADILENALIKIDYSPGACAFAAQALERRRTVRKDQCTPTQSGSHDGLVLCVPLVADQKPIGVLRICRSVEGFNGPEAEALEELLMESGKHIALALKKDEDDRKAITDVLTSLYIKRHFLQMMEKLRGDAVSGGNGFCLVLCDIDHFKKVNDTHGHLSGDMILKGVAGVLRKELRTGDMAFRYGGEEMALLLPNASLDAAEQTAERLRSAVQGSTFRGEKGQAVPITISLGFAQHQAGLTSEALISRADRALYASKQNGRNRVTRWSPTLPDPLEMKDAKKENAAASGNGAVAVTGVARRDPST